MRVSRKTNSALALTVFSVFLLLMVGCGKGPGSPVALIPETPPQGLEQAVPANDAASSRHVIFGLYEMRLSEGGTFEVVPIRDAGMHVNVKNLLFPPKCIDCFVAQLLFVNGEHWQFSFTVKNPTYITGYDCRVILLDYGNIQILDPTSYTKTFALPSDTDPINPFVVFDTGNGQNKWEPGASATTIVNFFKPSGDKFSKIIFAIDGSYPGNQDDPYRITGVNAEPWFINIDGSNKTNIAATVCDWQNNVNFVNVDLSPLGGSSCAPMANLLGNLWVIEDIPYEAGGEGLGTHYLKITASSVGLETYNYVPVTVVDQNPTFSVQIQQDKTDVKVGETVNLTGDPINGTPGYFFDWDLHYNGISFKPEVTGENIQWDWDAAGYYTVRLRCKDQAGNVAWASANVTVGGTKPSIKVDSPNGGEVLVAGTDYEIKWSSTKVNGTIFIEYSKDSFVSDDQTIATNETNDGSFVWPNVPADYSETVKVRISSTVDPALNDTSDGFCAIQEAGPCGAGPNILTTTLPDALPGEAYSKQLECTGGEGFVTWVVLQTGDSLPGGLQLDPGGLLHGTALDGTDGTYHLKIQAFDSCLPDAQTDEMDYTLKVLNPGTTWLRDFGHQGGDHHVITSGIAVSNEDNIYITGRFLGVNDFDPGGSVDNHTALVGDDYAFLTSYDSSGGYLWTRTWGATIPDVNTFGRDVTVDSGGNIYASGFFMTGEVNFDPGGGTDNHMGPGNYLTKFKPDGTFGWAKTWSNIYYSEQMCPIAIDGDDNILLCRTDLQNNTLSIYKMDSSGSVLWDVDWSGMANTLEKDLAVDPDGNVYLTGDFFQTHDFDPGPGDDSRTSNGDADVYLLKLNSAGEYQWSRTWGGYGDDCYPFGAFIAVKNYIYVCGSFRWTVDFDPDPVGTMEKTASNNEGNMFISAFDLSGDFLGVTTWVQADPDHNYYYGMCMDDDSNSYVTGTHQLMKLDSNGSPLWSNGYFGDPFAIAVLSDGSPVVTGEGWAQRITSDG